MKIVAISDTHNHHKMLLNFPSGDILIHCGDFSDICTKKDLDSFSDWFQQQEFEYKILVFGNHDIVTDEKFYEDNWKRFHDQKVELPQDYWSRKGIITLVGESITLWVGSEKVKIWGHPGLNPMQNNWAWSLENFQESDKLWNSIPNDVDIIITHSPPYGILDRTDRGTHIGNEEYSSWLLKNSNKRLFCFFGHMHIPGKYILENVKLFNVSCCRDTYFGPRLKYKPVVLDI